MLQRENEYKGSECHCSHTLTHDTTIVMHTLIHRERKRVCNSVLAFGFWQLINVNKKQVCMFFSATVERG